MRGTAGSLADVIPSGTTAADAGEALMTRPSPGLRPPSPRKRGEGQHARASRFVALLPACGEKVPEGRMRGCPPFNFDGGLLQLRQIVGVDPMNPHGDQLLHRHAVIPGVLDFADVLRSDAMN